MACFFVVPCKTAKRGTMQTAHHAHAHAASFWQAGSGPAAGAGGGPRALFPRKLCPFRRSWGNENEKSRGWLFRGFLKRRIPGKNGEVSPRKRALCNQDGCSFSSRWEEHCPWVRFQCHSWKYTTPHSHGASSLCLGHPCSEETRYGFVSILGDPPDFLRVESSLAKTCTEPGFSC